MEILHDGSDRRTILVALEQRGDADDFYAYLEEDFDVIRAGSADECLKFLAERYTALSVVLIDVDMAKADGYAFLHAVAGDGRFDTIPIIVATTRGITEDDARCLDEGALDFMSPPYHRSLMKRRIENAIRVKSSTTFVEIESILRALPASIYFKDAEGRYMFSTHFWDRFHRDSDDPNWTICGKTDLDIRGEDNRENALMAMEADREIVRTGKGTTYVIEEEEDGRQEFIELVKRPVFNDDGTVKGIVALVNNITEHIQFQRNLERNALIDGLTGLGNRRAFDEYVASIQDSEVFPIVVISADCDELKKVNDTYGHLMGDDYIRTSALMIKSALPEEARVFRTGGDEFVAFWPGATLEEADECVRGLQGNASQVRLGEGHISISFGMALIEGPDSDMDHTLSAADRIMYDNKAAAKRARA